MSEVPHYHLAPKEIGANLRFRRALYREAGRDAALASTLRRMCSEDILFYINAFCWTYDPRSKVKVTPFITYGFQDVAILALVDCVETGQDAAVPKSRDMGATWMGLVAIEWLWHFAPDLSFLLVSRNEDYVDKRGDPKSLFWKIDFLHQPRWLLPRDRWLGDKDPGRKTLHLLNNDNSSVIDGESTTGDAGRGDRRTAMFIDEHAAFEIDAGFAVLNATRDTTNCRIFNSTPQGSNNGFFEVVHKLSAKVLRLHWSEHPEKARGSYTTNEKTGRVELLDKFRGHVSVRRKGEKPKEVIFPDNYPFQLDQARPRTRSPWYDNECARCVSLQEIAQELDIDFVGSAFPFFDPDFIEVLIRRYARAPLVRGNLEFDPETLQPKRFVEHEKGLLELWIPLAAGDRPARDRHFCLGSDISAGTGASNSVTSIGDRETGEKIGVLRTPNMRPHEFAQLTISLARWFNDGYLTWDAGGVGAVFTKCVIAAGYGNIYYRRQEKKLSQKISDEPGYHLNAQNKVVLLEDLRNDMADHRFINRSEQGLRETLQFVRKPDGTVEHSASANSQDPSGARSAHGDEVIADAMLCIGLREQKTEQKAQEPTEPVGSLAWRRKLREDELRSQSQEGLGAGW